MFSFVLTLALSALCFLCLVNASPIDLPLNETDIITQLDARQTTPPDLCATGVHMIVAPGKGAAMKNGLLQSLIGRIKRRYPGSGNARTVMYDPNQSIPIMARMIITTYIKNYAASCPQTPIVLIGYSVGGIATMDTLCGQSEGIGPPTQGIPLSYNANIIAAIVYGEEAFRAGQVYSRGTCPNDAPLYPRQNPAGCRAYASDIMSFCDVADPECCTGGLDPQTHKDYPMKYDTTSLNFIVSHHDAYCRMHPLYAACRANPPVSLPPIGATVGGAMDAVGGAVGGVIPG